MKPRSIGIVRTLVIALGMSPLYGVAQSSYTPISGYQTPESFCEKCTFTMPGENVDPGKSVIKVLPKGGRPWVEQITLEGYALRNDCMAQVWVNGHKRGTAYLPKHDPQYVVTVRDYAGEFEIKNPCDGATVVFSSITVNVPEYYANLVNYGMIRKVVERSPASEISRSPASDDVTELSDNLQSIINNIDGAIDGVSWVTFVAAIRKPLSDFKNKVDVDKGEIIYDDETPRLAKKLLFYVAIAKIRVDDLFGENQHSALADALTKVYWQMKKIAGVYDEKWTLLNKNAQSAADLIFKANETQKQILSYLSRDPYSSSGTPKVKVTVTPDNGTPAKTK